MSILITGAGGFVGERALQAWSEGVAWPKVDLRNRDAVKTAVAALPELEGVLHLAALSSVQRSFQDPATVYEVNFMGTVNLLDALTTEGKACPFLFVSTAAVYGDPDGLPMPLQEASPIAPNSPYAASKAAAEQAVLEWGRRMGQRAMIARPSNHTGPGQPDHYFLPSMAQQITRVPRGEAVSIKTGDLNVSRDFTHVDDVVAAYRSLLNSGQAGGIYNVASGQARPISELLEGLIRASQRRVAAEVDSGRVRGETPRPLSVCIERLQADTGWAPTRELEQLYTDLIEFWESR